MPDSPVAKEGREEPVTDSQKDTTEGKNIVDYNEDADYEGSESKHESVPHGDVKENSDTEYAKMKILQSGFFPPENDDSIF